MTELWYYTHRRYCTHRNQESMVFEVWVRTGRQEESTLVASCRKRGDANLIRKVLQDHADARRKVA